MIRFRCQKEPLGSWCDHVEEEGQAAGETKRRKRHRCLGARPKLRLSG